MTPHEQQVAQQLLRIHQAGASWDLARSLTQTWRRMDERERRFVPHQLAVTLDELANGWTE